MNITVLIAEEDSIMRHILKNALEEIPDINVIGEAENSLEAVQLTKEMVPHAIFLDITMQGKDGLDAVREISDFSPKTAIIFITDYENFTHHVLEAYAFDYLIMPFKTERIRKIIERLKVSLAEKEKAQNVSVSPNAKTGLAKILIKEDGKIILINIRDIIFLTREGRYTIVQTMIGKYKIRENLKELEQKLAGHKFFRSHRGFIINLNMVKEMQPWGRKTCKVILSNAEETVIMTKARVRQLHQYLDFLAW